jgi:hypothetical protein
MSVVQTNGRYYYAGEFPPPLDCEYRDKNNVLVAAALSGATLSALTWIDGANANTVACTNGDDGTFTIDWEDDDANPTDFAAAGLMDVLVKVAPAAGGAWYLPRFQLPVHIVPS